MTATAPAAAPNRSLSVTALPATRRGLVVVAVVGEVDTFTAPLLDACLNAQARRSGVRSIVVDLRQVSSLGGAGVRAVVDAARSCRRRGARLSVRCGAGPVRHALHLAGFGDPTAADPLLVRGARRRRVGGRPSWHGSVAAPARSAS